MTVFLSLEETYNETPHASPRRIIELLAYNVYHGRQ